MLRMWYLCCCQVVVYRGKKKMKDLIKFLDKEMKKAKKERVKVNDLLHYSAWHDCSGFMLFFCVCAAFFSPFVIKINFPLCLQEDEDRRKYIEAIKAEEAQKANESKDEL